ncbi:MAG: helix-turn-helix domain-containing protein [Chloroflexi bacterium]|nr:helix-turn-helix domain-containing protein [Chloroflexota bacterium]
MTANDINPLGQSVIEGATRRAARSREYREHAARLAPYRVIARAVILARTDMGFTQDQLGSALGTTGSAISRIESGTRPVTLDTLARLGAALDITFVVGSPRAAGVGCVVVPQDAIEVSAKPALNPTTRRQGAGARRPAGDGGVVGPR